MIAVLYLLLLQSISTRSGSIGIFKCLRCVMIVFMCGLPSVNSSYKSSGMSKWSRPMHPGPYDLNMHSAGECDTGTHQVQVNLTLTKPRGSVAHASGTAVLPLGVSDKIQVTVRASKLEKNGKRMKDFLVRSVGGACSALRALAPDVGKQLYKALGTDRCPVKPGNYTYDLDITFDLGGIPAAVYGRYEVNLELYLAKTTTRIGCLYFIVDFVPKRNSKRRG